MMAWRVGVPIGILSTRYSMQIKNCVDGMIWADFDNSVKLLETFLIDLEGKELLLLVKEMAVVERNPQCVHSIVL